MWMSISSGRSARDLAGAIGHRATRRAKEVLVGVVGDNGDGKRASAQWQRDERIGFGVVAICSNHRDARTATLGTAAVSRRPTNCTVTALRRGASFEFVRW